MTGRLRRCCDWTLDEHSGRTQSHGFDNAARKSLLSWKERPKRWCFGMHVSDVSDGIAVVLRDIVSEDCHGIGV